MPTGQAHLDFTLAGLNVLGGVMAYKRKGSVPSLVGGLTFAGAFATSGYLTSNVDGYYGHVAGGVTSSLLLGVGAWRLSQTKKFMPAGLLTGMGALASLYHIMKAREWAD